MMRPSFGLAWILGAFVVVAGGGCSSASPSGTPDAGSDATTPDARAEASQDTGPADVTKPPADAKSKCAPGDISGWKPVAHGQIGPHANVCSVSQLTTLVADCFASTSSTVACDAFYNDPANTTCNGCWSGPVTAANWAPFLYVDNPGQSTYTNVAGCIALSDPTEKSCAAATEVGFECLLAACQASCPVPSTGDPTAAIAAFTQCFADAECGVCAKYSAPADSCGMAIATGGGPAAYCSTANSSADALLQYFILACGPPPTDAGAPGDASTDAH